MILISVVITSSHNSSSFPKNILLLLTVKSHGFPFSENPADPAHRGPGSILCSGAQCFPRLSELAGLAQPPWWPSAQMCDGRKGERGDGTPLPWACPPTSPGSPPSPPTLLFPSLLFRLLAATERFEDLRVICCNWLARSRADWQPVFPNSIRCKSSMAKNDLEPLFAKVKAPVPFSSCIKGMSSPSLLFFAL